MIHSFEESLLHQPATYFYAACLACGWCGPVRRDEAVAGRDDDNHLAAKLAARAGRREVPASLTPEGSVGPSSPSTESPGGPRRPGS